MSGGNAQGGAGHPRQSNPLLLTPNNAMPVTRQKTNKMDQYGI